MGGQSRSHSATRRWSRDRLTITPGPAGRADVADFDQSLVSLHLDDVCIAEQGLVAESYREEDAARVMAGDEFRVLVDLGRGDATETVWTSDLSYEYVRINAEYRT